jgi:hypothetical protein
MNKNKYGEITNGKETYSIVASLLALKVPVGIAWTDGYGTHYDIVFNMGLGSLDGHFQGGLRNTDLFVSIMRKTAWGFKLSIKHGDYIQEKLGIYGQTGDKLKELINGVIEELNRLGVNNENN